VKLENTMPPAIFCTDDYAPLSRELVDATGGEPGQLERRIFPDGERYLRVLTQVRERDVVMVSGTSTDTATLDTFDLACGLVRLGCRRLVLVIPFFGHATMERSVRSGEVVTAKTRALLLSSIPLAHGGNHAAMLDLHVDGITHYFEGGIVPHHLYGKSIITKAARELGGEQFVLGSVDAGRAKWVESLANDLGVGASFILKRRLGDSKTEVIALSAAVQGQHVVIYDDMIRTGGSLLSAARAYRDAGASKISTVTTHGVFPHDAYTRLRQSGAVERIICTNSHPWALRHAAQADDFVAVRSCAPVFVEFLKSLGM
jgi:ribose-phosphate pyrophosphokinase